MRLIAAAPDPIAEIACFIVVACWLGILAILVLGKRAAAPGAHERDPKSMLGLLLQCAGYILCFAAFRPLFSPLFAMSKAGETILGLFAALLALASTWFCFAAARALGKQWALVARVIKGHELVRRGPYSIVRNPIYLAMLGEVIASALAFSRWQALPAAVALYLAGTAIRIRAEQNLLCAAFGAQFDDYARRVPAFLPRLL